MVEISAERGDATFLALCLSLALVYNASKFSWIVTGDCCMAEDGHFHPLESEGNSHKRLLSDTEACSLSATNACSYIFVSLDRASPKNVPGFDARYRR